MACCRPWCTPGFSNTARSSLRRWTVHVTEVVNGVKKESHLCEECARAAGGKFTFSITDILANLIEPVKPAGGKAQEAGAPRCPECGISYAEFKAKARLGCAND